MPLKDTMEQEDDLAMSEEEMYRIIRDTGIMRKSGVRDPSVESNSKSFVTLQPHELQDTARFEELADSEESEAEKLANDQDVAPSAINSVPRTLVELIDGDESLPHSLARPGSTDSTLVPLTISSIDEDETFKVILWMVVFSTLWLSLDLMIHAQYGQDRGFQEELSRAINVLPALCFVIYFTAKNPTSYLTRAFLFGWSAIGGSYMIHIVNRASYLQVMRRCPILGSIWIWSVVQLDLPSALASLALVISYVKYNGLSVIFPS